LSPGPDKYFHSEKKPSYDDVGEWTSLTHYFQQETDDLNQALAEHYAKTLSFPQNEEELKPVLVAAKLTPERLTDPWGRAYYFTFSQKSRYWDRIEMRTYVNHEGEAKKATEITPVTQKEAYIEVMSYGAEGKPESAFVVAEFSRVIAEMDS